MKERNYGAIALASGIVLVAVGADLALGLGWAFMFCGVVVGVVGLLVAVADETSSRHGGPAGPSGRT